MEAFHFKLEKILQYREGLTKEAERQLAVVVGQCNALVTKMEHLTGEQRRNRLAQTGNDLDSRRVASLYDERLTFQLKQLKTELEVLEEQKAVLQQNYRNQLKEQKVLENLKETQLKEYKIKLARHKDKVLDDLISSRYEQS